MPSLRVCYRASPSLHIPKKDTGNSNDVWSIAVPRKMDEMEKKSNIACTKELPWRHTRQIPHHDQRNFPLHYACMHKHVPQLLIISDNIIVIELIRISNRTDHLQLCDHPLEADNGLYQVNAPRCPWSLLSMF